MRTTAVKNKSRKKLLVFSVAFVAVLLVIGGILALNNRLPFQAEKTAATSDAKTTSDVQSAQSDFTSDDTEKSDGGAIDRSDSTGTISDTNGSTAVASNKAVVVSQNGEITIYSPAANSTVSNKVSVSGASKLNTVSYRINDDAVGVVASGVLNVVNGRFSGTLEVRSKAKTGQIDFFATTADGNEYGNVSVPIKF